MMTIERIDVGSAFRVGAVVSGLVGIFFAVLVGLLQLFALTGLDAISSVTSEFGRSSSAFFTGFGVLSLVFGTVCGGIAFAILGGVTAAIYAFAYNLSARWFGGLRVQVNEPMPIEKLKRSEFDL